MTRLLFDIETNGFLDEVSVVWCLCVKNLDAGTEHSFGPEQIDEGLELLDQATVLYGHNIQSYDLPALNKVKGWVPPISTRVCDTLIWGRYAHPDLKNEDLNSGRKRIKSLSGRQSLSAWGVRLGLPKTLHADFSRYSPEMQDYCLNDVWVNDALLLHLESTHVSAEALELEHSFARLADRIHEHGFSFDIEKATALCDSISQDRERLLSDLCCIFPSRLEVMKTPAYYRAEWPDGTATDFKTKGAADIERKARGLKPKDVLIGPGPLTVREHPFNPGSLKQIRQQLYLRHQWISPDLTDKGLELLEKGGEYNTIAQDYGSIREGILRRLDWPEAASLADYLMLRKRIGQIRDGKNGWLRLVRPNGRIHHSMIGIGCVTFRGAHFAPNLGQIPHVLTRKDGTVLLGAEGRYGAECRELFTASPGYTLVGIDLSGIEARMLAHFLAPFDKGAYIDQVLHGDIHQLNCDAFKQHAGYSVARGDGKSLMYAWAYGAGDTKLGTIIAKVSREAGAEFERSLCYYRKSKIESEATKSAYRRIGRKIRQSFERGITGLGNLVESVKKAAEKGYLAPLDGRRIPVRSPHAALNTLLQGGSAIVMKRWCHITMEEVKRHALDVHPLVIVHDEKQSEVSDKHISPYMDLGLGAIRRAGEFYRLNIRLDGEAKCGRNWRETH